MKIELGGGKTPKGDGFVNVDILDCADIQHDLESGPLPFEDDSVDELYSAHCFEHLKHPFNAFKEVVRVCKMGAQVELRFPHWNHSMALCCGHFQTISDRQIDIICDQPDFLFKPPKKLKLVNRHYQIDVAYSQLRDKFPKLTDEEVARHIADCCHEVRYQLKVVPWT